MKYIAVFLRKIGEYQKLQFEIDNKKDKITSKKEITEKGKTVKRPNYVRVGSVSFSPLDEVIHFDKENSYPVQLEAFSFQDKDKLFYYYDYDTGDLIGLETLLEYNIKPKDLNKVTGKRIVEQIVAGAKHVQGNPLIYIILPLITAFVGIGLGFWMGGGLNTPTT